MGEPKYRRKVPAVHQILEMLLLQGSVIRCYRTKKRITLKNFRDTEREHIVELGLFADASDKAAHDTPDNWRMSFSEAHSIITNGTKATSAGSSKHRIAKAVRMEKDRLAKAKDRWRARGDLIGDDDEYLARPRAVMPVKWIDEAEARKIWPMSPKKRSGFRKDPNRVRGVDGKVKARKPRLDRGR